MDKDKKNLIVSVGIILAIILVIVFLIFPQISRVKNLSLKIKEIKTNLSQKNDLLNKIDEKIAEYNKLTQKIQKINLAFPSQKQKAELIVQLESLTKETGLALKSINFNESKKGEEKGAYRVLNISLSLSGTYQAFKNFLVSLEKNIRLMDVQSVSFSSPEKVVASGLIGPIGSQIVNELEFSVNLNTYYK